MLSRAEKLELIELLEEKQRRAAGKRFWAYYPDTGPLRRELYAKHLEFFAMGRDLRERAAMAGNRVGKTEGIGAYEVTCHLTGLYPDWWTGRRFDKPVNALCGGDTGTTVRDIIVGKLLGPQEDRGSGMVPRDLIGRIAPGMGIPGSVDYAKVKHVSGGWSTVQFRSYDQGRKAWQGTERDVVWEDEEPPEDIHTEAVMRTMTTGGIVLCTFTPLEGLTNVALSFMADHGEKWSIQIDWDDVPHLSEKDKAELLEAIPPYQREARTKGIPALGSGVIYPVAESVYVIDPIAIPAWWPKAYGMDVGWNKTAAVWGAWDRESDTIHVFGEHYMGEAPPQIHADAIKARGYWIPGAIDPASAGSGQKDGVKLVDEYRDLGLDLEFADNAVEAGIHAVYRRIASGRLKIHRTCQNLIGELRLYRRDEKGKIVKERDHAADALRYLVMSGMARGVSEPSFETWQDRPRGRSQTTGY